MSCSREFLFCFLAWGGVDGEKTSVGFCGGVCFVALCEFLVESVMFVSKHVAALNRERACKL